MNGILIALGIGVLAAIALGSKPKTVPGPQDQVVPPGSGQGPGSGSTAPGPGYTSYTVVRGDSLSIIARRFYGDAMLWPTIYAANRDILSDPNRIYPGQVLKIPPKP